MKTLEKLCPHVTFHSYYKYAFTYHGEYLGHTEDFDHIRYKVTCRYGDNADDIYRYEVSIHTPVPLFPLEQWTHVKVERANRGNNFKYEVIFEEDF